MSSIEQQEREARRLFEAFHRRAPRAGTQEIVQIGGLAVPTVGLEVGRLIGLAYQSRGNGVRYFHEHEDIFRSRPSVYVNSDGRQVFILEGGWRFTERGFIG